MLQTCWQYFLGQTGTFLLKEMNKNISKMAQRKKNLLIKHGKIDNVQVGRQGLKHIGWIIQYSLKLDAANAFLKS